MLRHKFVFENPKACYKHIFFLNPFLQCLDRQEQPEEQEPAGEQFLP